jgi:hypothetical protein
VKTIAIKFSDRINAIDVSTPTDTGDQSIMAQSPDLRRHCLVRAVELGYKLFGGHSIRTVQVVEDNLADVLPAAQLNQRSFSEVV